MARETPADRTLREKVAVFEAMVSHRFVTDLARDRRLREVFSSRR